MLLFIVSAGGFKRKEQKKQLISCKLHTNADAKSDIQYFQFPSFNIFFYCKG